MTPDRMQSRSAMGGWAALLLTLATASSVSAYSLEDILSFPYPTQLVAAGKVERIAWEINDKGVRNLWTAAGPHFEALQLTRYTQDDGQALGGLRLTEDGSLLVYVRGGGPNAAGENPNPTHDPEGAVQEIWAVATSGGEPWKLAAGQGVELSPLGDVAVFADGSQVSVVSLTHPEAEADPQEPEKLFTARGNLGNLHFSSDGTHLAFVSDRGDHSFVGVYQNDDKTITWIDPSVDRDTSPVWSPDGRHLAFVRMPGLTLHELPDLTAAVPFAIWVADPQTGMAHVVWSSPGADGGFAQLYPDQPLAWAGDERLVFTSEHDGWLHAYSVSLSGGEAVDVTAGEAEIETFAVSDDGAFVFFSGNHGDTNRRHLWRVPARGGPPVPLTAGDGIDTDPVPLAGGRYVAYRSADARRPPAISLVSRTSGEGRTVSPIELPDTFPTDQLVEPQPVVFTTVDGLEIDGQLFLPPAAKAGDGRPAVIFMHGGPIRQMLLGFHYLDYYAICYAFNQYLASRGAVVLSVNFRTGIGYGRDFRRARNQGPRGASEYRDILAAGHYLQGRSDVDPGRIGLWGGSYGGYLTALGLARDSSLFKAGVDLHGVHDWAFRGTDFPIKGGGWGLQGEELLKLARRSSPVADLSHWSSPVLFVHGDDDRNVMFIQTTDLVQRLRQRGVHVETLVFPDEVHGFLRYESWLRALQAAAGFFDRFLVASR